MWPLSKTVPGSDMYAAITPVGMTPALSVSADAPLNDAAKLFAAKPKAVLFVEPPNGDAENNAWYPPLVLL